MPKAKYDPRLDWFGKGQRVQYALDGMRPEHRGRFARVIQPVKSRGVITIEWEDAPAEAFYDAHPNSLTPV